jgi:hypothetical protein
MIQEELERQLFLYESVPALESRLVFHWLSLTAGSHSLDLESQMFSYKLRDNFIIPAGLGLVPWVFMTSCGNNCCHLIGNSTHEFSLFTDASKRRNQASVKENFAISYIRLLYFQSF